MVIAAISSASQAQAQCPLERSWVGPAALALDHDGQTIYVVSSKHPKVIAVNLNSKNTLCTITLPEPGNGLAFINNPPRLAVSFAGSNSGFLIWDLNLSQNVLIQPARAGACSPVANRQGNILYLCNRFDNSVSAFELSSGKETGRLGLVREPIAAALSPDERILVVANHLADGSVTAAPRSAAVSLIDTATFSLRTNVFLPDGCNCLRGICISPDGQWCAAAHNYSRFRMATTQVERGWMNDSALSLINLKDARLTATILLDTPERGAANPWAIQWSADNQKIWVTHSGVHEVSAIDIQPALERVSASGEGKLIDNLSFLKWFRKRIALPGNGPRSMALNQTEVFVGNYFSDTIDIIDCVKNTLVASIPLSTGWKEDMGYLGERLFHDATISHQSWQSCASCHPEGRSDGLTWDLLNDGIGNPKKTKSLLLAYATPPAMSLGVRATMEDAVVSGLRHILFAVRPDSDAAAINQYLRSLKPERNPFLLEGRLSPSAQRGKGIFENPEIGCSECHPAPLFTDKNSHAVGTGTIREPSGSRFDTPSLVECWRNSPYLHSGQAANPPEVFTQYNPTDLHGATSRLNQGQIEDLVAYVKSL